MKDDFLEKRASRVRIEVWSDLVCPWCYLGKRRLERALKVLGNRDDVEIVHRAYMLYPWLPRGTSVDRRSMLMRKYGLTGEQADDMNAKMTAVAATEGLTYRLSGGQTGNTATAHQLVHLARDHGREESMLERLYRAFFTEQRSIFSVEALLPLASDAGLDPQEVERSLGEERYAAAVEADIAAAHGAHIGGVPFFLFGDGLVVAGAQIAETFERVLDEAWTRSRTRQ